MMLTSRLFFFLPRLYPGFSNMLLSMGGVAVALAYALS
jgi:hypothetical protein